MKIKPALGTKKQQQVIRELYPLLPKTDIEKGLIEKISDRVVVTANFSWADVGSWKVIKDVLSSGKGNVIKGLWSGLDTEDSIIYSYTDQLVSTFGLKNSVVIITPEVILVADKNKTEDLKLLINVLEKDPNLRRYL